MAVFKDLGDMFSPVVESMGYELVGVEFIEGSGHAKLRVYIDSQSGVNLDDCAAISHQISGILDVEDPITQAFDLEISSPGINRPLFGCTDYRRFSGEKVNIKLSVPVDGRKNFKGVLQAVTEHGNVLVEVDGLQFELPMADIRKANLIGEI